MHTDRSRLIFSVSNLLWRHHICPDQTYLGDFLGRTVRPSGLVYRRRQYTRQSLWSCSNRTRHLSAGHDVPPLLSRRSVDFPDGRPNLCPGTGIRESRCSSNMLKQQSYLNGRLVQLTDATWGWSVAWRRFVTVAIGITVAWLFSYRKWCMTSVT